MCGGGKWTKWVEEEGGSGDVEGSQRGKRGRLGISCGSRSQALVGLDTLSLFLSATGLTVFYLFNSRVSVSNMMF